MTYTSGQLIQATDYNGFVSTTVGANINATWNTSYGQTALATVSATNTVTATQWASLVNTLASLGTHTNTTITARTAPVTGNTIAVLSAVNTDITNCFTNRYNAYAVGSQFTGWSGTNSKTAGTSGASWSITFTNTVTFASSAAATYFFNAGGLIKIDVAKSSTGATGDPEWNDLATTLCGDIWISGLATAHTIAGVSYTGVTKVGGTGTPTTLSTGTGWDALSAGAAATIVYKQFADTAPYTANFIQHSIAKGAGSDTLVITTLWQAADAQSDPITGGTAASGATPGTAACTIVTYYPPETTTLTSSWGTPTVAATTT
jgi:hypothetical protein